VVHTGGADWVAPSFRPPEWPWSVVGPEALMMSRTNSYVGTSTAYAPRFGIPWPLLVQWSVNILLFMFAVMPFTLMSFICASVINHDITKVMGQ
jgi:hypothetical protein